MIVGFTGTRDGMTDRQKSMLKDKLEKLDYAVFHHGDCIGADEQAHTIAKSIGYVMVVHPPKNPNARAFMAEGKDTLMEEKEYLERNRDIVNACDLLIACPKTNTEVLRSGTWATVRYAHKKEKEVYIIEPTCD